MRFQKTRRWEGYNVTPRKVSAFHRKQRLQCEALPLYSEEIRSQLHDVDTEMARRACQQQQAQAERRAMAARHWRQARARFHALPAPVRETVSNRWRSWTGPLTGSCLTHLIETIAAEAEVSADDFAHVSLERRREQTIQIKAHARQQVRHIHSRRLYSPGALCWMAPFFEPTAERSEPSLYLDTILARHLRLDAALADWTPVPGTNDPTGREGYFHLDETAFRFEIRYYRHRSAARSPVPWNSDSTRRILWLGLADEQAPDNFADAGTRLS